MIAGHALKKTGIVAGGKSIFLAADFVDVLREGGAGILLGAFEHQVFEKMCEAGFTPGFVGGADLVPDHVRDHRRAMIGHDDNFKAVRQGEVGNVRPGGGMRGAYGGSGNCETEQQYFGHETTSEREARCRKHSTLRVGSGSFPARRTPFDPKIAPRPINARSTRPSLTQVPSAHLATAACTFFALA